MWRTRVIGLAAAAIMLTGGSALAASSKNFGTHLHGDQEVPVRQTPAQGQVTFQVSEDGSEIRYKLNVANIENVFQAHIHLGPSGSNGPIVVWLYPSTDPVAVHWVVAAFRGESPTGPSRRRNSSARSPDSH